MTRALSFRGDAIITTITTDVASGDVSIPIAASDGWPTGSGSKPFVAYLIAADLSVHEKVLVASRTGLSLAVAIRGWDDTVAASFLSGATIMHVPDAASMQAMSDHIDDPDPAGHSTLLNPTRHDVAIRHQFGGALVRPSSMAPVGTAQVVGATQTVADGAHAHALDPAVAGPGLQLLAGILGLMYDDATVTVSGDTLQVKAAGIGSAQMGSHAVTAPAIDPATVWPGLFPATGVLTVVGQIADGLITRAKLAADAQKSVDVAWGYIDSSLSNTDQNGVGGGGGVAVTNMDATLTAVANRRYRTTVFLPRIVQNGTLGEIQVIITDGSNTKVTGSNDPLYCSTATVAGGMVVLYETTASAGGVGTHTRRARVSTSGTSVDIPGSTHKGLILIEDIGPS